MKTEAIRTPPTMESVKPPDTVLIVEDDEGLNRLIAKRLSREGFETASALTGKEAISQVKKRPDVLLLLDFKLPDMNGKELLETLDAAGLCVPFVIMTGCGDEKTAVDLMKRGAIDYLVKTEEFIDLIPQKIRIACDYLIKQQQLTFTEKALQKSEHDKRLILSSVSELVSYQNKELQVQWANQASADSVNTTVDALIGRYCYEIWAHRNAPCDGCPVLKAVETGETQEMEQTTPDGRIWIIRGFPVREEEGDIVGAVEVTREITTQKKAETELIESEAKYRQLVETLNEGIWVVDEKAYTSFVNPKMADMLGYTTEEMMGKHLFLFMDDEGVTEAKEKLQKREAGITERHEFTFMKKNGESVYTLVSTSPIFDEQDKYTGALAAVVDIDDRKKTLDELHASEERFKKLSNVTFEGILIHDKGIAVDVNQSFLDMFGYEREEVIGKDLIEMLILEEFHETIKENISKRVAAPYEVMARKKDGSSLPVEVQARDVQVGDVEFRVAAIRDITDRKKLEDQYIQSQKMESVGRLAGGVAHDFNNQLSVIMGHSEMLLMNMSPQESHYRGLKEISESARRSADLTRQLLAFARKQTISPVVLHLNDNLEGMLKMLRRLIGEDIDLAWLPGSQLWLIHMDPSQINQLMANLCINARDAVQGVGKVSVKTQNVTLDAMDCRDHAGLIPGEYVMLTVSDTGCGMDEETLKNIFEPFFTTKGVGKGTGLGLSTVYGIVKQNNGFINARSKPGAGTTFTVYLPRYMGKRQEGEKEGPAEVPHGRGETVLIVEDEPGVMKVARQTLERFGYRVLSFENPVEALEAAQHYPGEIRVLITDVIMPEMNGKELAQAIEKSRPDIRILYMSGYTANAIAHHGVLDKGVNFIQKPFSPVSLARKVREMLEH